LFSWQTVIASHSFADRLEPAVNCVFAPPLAVLLQYQIGVGVGVGVRVGVGVGVGVLVGVGVGVGVRVGVGVGVLVGVGVGVGVLVGVGVGVGHVERSTGSDKQQDTAWQMPLDGIR
jgi:hypothetical protein